MRPARSFHAHDFDWNEHAVMCRAQLACAGEADRVEEYTGEELSTMAQEHWDAFHAKNNGKVYKPRNYLTKEFPDLITATKVLEVGCGYGSAIFPLLAECPSMHAHVFDFSPHAINILKSNPLYDPARCCAYVCDIVTGADDLGVPPTSMDVVLMVFVLSAIPPTSLSQVVQKVYRALRPGGVVCFRDYGLYDLAMMRSTKKVHAGAPCHDENLGNVYYRGDGTLATFFSIQDVAALFVDGGFAVVENDYCTVRLRNRRTNTNMDRVWVHGTFVKR
ncbi:hypothetical protein, variant [Aphanomyces invadans]|uniref:tRNA N(3)-methylcytidine methyltransferase n=1 Tax=Aphanomyces invadans TaxID=157072 RepID=A0A024UKL2_9STRA|nr:hypothetical protein, variant [Aphanomyces invadans]ETW06382.1 hypothetical protein, variant [Aphanomyces invadans]|eukprot:XP_008864457.1 hypothetical protein, variant [Aphanomyces invadans]